MSVKFQLKITQQIIYFNSWKMFGAGLKESDLKYIALNANELHIPTPSPEEGVAYTSFCTAYLQQ